MTITMARGVRAWLVRRSAPLLLAVTTAGMVAGGAAWLAGASGAADAAWLATAACGLGYALWVAVASIAHGRVSVDVIALLALAGAIAVDELLAAAVISVMLTSGRALEAWAAYRARQDLSALLERAPRTGRRYRDGSLETVPLDQIAAGDLLLVAAGDVIPVDGMLAAGAAVLDESALTGEALPVEHVQGDTLRSGTLNAAGPFDLRASTQRGGQHLCGDRPPGQRGGKRAGAVRPARRPVRHVVPAADPGRGRSGVGAGRRRTGGGRPGRRHAVPAHPRGAGRPGLRPVGGGAPRDRGEERRQCSNALPGALRCCSTRRGRSPQGSPR